MWVYRHANHQSHVRTTIRCVEPDAEGAWHVTVDTMFTLAGARAEERLSVRPDGVYVWHHGRWHGPDPVLPLRPGLAWQLGQDSHYPVTARVRGPVPVKLDFDLLAECLRLDQVGDDGERVRTEWYAPRLGLVRWIDHWRDHDELYDLVYFCCGRTGHAIGDWPTGLAAA